MIRIGVIRRKRLRSFRICKNRSRSSSSDNKFHLV
jgi:hypothetical protein